MRGNLFEIFSSRMEADTQREFISTTDGRRFSYADMLALTARIAGHLRDLGIRPGDRVAVQVDKSPEAIMLYLACLRAGAVYLPLNTAYTEEELGYFLGDAEPSLFVHQSQEQARADRLAGRHGVAHTATLDTDGGGSLMEGALACEPDEHIEPCTSEDLAAILYTSGTTGRSKGAMLTHGNLASNSATLADYWRFTYEDRLIHALPIFHTHGLFVACNVVLMAGASMIFLPKFDADAILALMPQATSLMGVPTFYTRLLQHAGLNRESTANMRLFTSGSAPLTAETHHAFEERTGHRILERYGMTETNMNTSNPYDGERRGGTVGFPLPGVELRIADRGDGSPLPDGEIGIIEVRGPNVFTGYWRMPEKTRQEFREDGFFITGDLGYIDEQHYVHIVGRDKDLVISGGYNVYPKEVEQLIDELPGVVESAVIGLPHPDLGEGVAAAVVIQAGAKLDEAEVIASLRDRIARYKQPKKVYFVDELPRNVMGKVQKNELRERFKQAFSSNMPPAA